MPRRLSEEKRHTILQAAATVIATQGLSASPTSAIARAAGVAEGTLFLYFRTKHDLANALYVHLKGTLAQAMFAGQPRPDDLRAWVLYHWDEFVKWGVTHGDASRAIEQLAASGLLTAATLAAANGPYAAIEKVTRAAMRAGLLQTMPFAFLAGTFEAMAQMTIRQTQAGTGAPGTLRRIGFEMFWRAISKHNSP